MLRINKPDTNGSIFMKAKKDRGVLLFYGLHMQSVKRMPQLGIIFQYLATTIMHLALLCVRDEVCKESQFTF